MKNSSYCIVIFLIAMVTTAFPQPQSQIDKQTDNLAATYAEYTAYLELVTSAQKGDERKEQRTKFEKLKDDCMLFSLMLASEGRKKEIAINVTNARIELAKKEMLKEIDGDNANLSILINKHQEGLMKLIQNPPTTLLAIIQRNAKEAEGEKR